MIACVTGVFGAIGNQSRNSNARSSDMEVRVAADRQRLRLQQDELTPMTAVTYSNHDGEPLGAPTAELDAAAETSRRWRSVWRIHFYAGMFAMPFILLMALTGLVILYTQPIQDLTQGDLRTVDRGTETVSFDEQAAAVEAAYPDAVLTSLTMPTDAEHSVVFGIDDGSSAGRQVFVDQYSGEVLGSTNPDGGIVGLSNRMHGTLNNDRITIDLPTVSALWDDGPVMREYVVGDLILELLGVWTLVLVASGLFLWWPRRTRRAADTAATAAAAAAAGKRSILGVRRGVKGRARWRDLHGVSGVILLGLILVTIVSGLAWSTYWGPHFSAIANEITPNSWTDAPPSPLGERGDLDRLGNKINWNTGDRPIPASYATPTDGTAPAAISLDDIVTIANDDGMKPGYTISFPGNSEDEAGNPIYGSFTVSNSWPRKTGEARDLYLDQFTGQTLAVQDVYGYGAVSRGMDTLVSVHMGTQLGIVSRLMMTALSLLAIFSVISGFAMFWKRRRPGTAGLPRRPIDVRLSRNLAIFAVGLAVVFPVWGVTALVVLGIDRFVIRKIRPLRTAFGQPA